MCRISLRNPLGLARAGLLAQRADLRPELAELKKSGVPVLALTGERDTLIPLSAFEAVCDTVGADRRVVSGGHAWLLVNPDSFGEVLASTVDVQVVEHEAVPSSGSTNRGRASTEGNAPLEDEISGPFLDRPPRCGSSVSQRRPWLVIWCCVDRRSKRARSEPWPATSKTQPWSGLRSRLEIGEVCSPTAPPS